MPLEDPPGQPARLKLSPDGRMIASIDLNGAIKVWDAQTGADNLAKPSSSHR